MQFNSYIFILTFLPFSIFLYFFTNRFAKNENCAKIILIIISLIFYSILDYRLLLMFMIYTSVNYVLASTVSKNKNRCLLGIIIVSISFILIYFKYANFIIVNLNEILGWNKNLISIIIPLGISFITFSQISYTIDIFNKEIEDINFIDYLLYMSFFPKLIQGPILFYNELITQFNKKENRLINYDNIYTGLTLLSVGLFKKVILADTLNGLNAFKAIQLSSLESFILMVGYTFQIYFDFSGYCDMANGIAKMFNINLPFNFNSPYKSFSILEFWERWHITLSRFFRKYIYIPLGGNRKGQFRTYVNIMIIYCISGIWHGANWTFLVWGVLHGLACCLTRSFEDKWEKLFPVFRWIFTFFFVCVAWTFFNADSINEAISFIKNMISMRDFSVRSEIMHVFDILELNILSMLPGVSYLASSITGFHMWTFLFITMAFILNGNNYNKRRIQPSLKNNVMIISFLVITILSFSGVTVFIYQGF